jgi:dCTP deaminase
MSILSDYEIAERCNFKKKEEMMIWPFSNKQVTKNKRGEKIVSYGLSSYGYDVRCSDWFVEEKPLYSSVYKEWAPRDVKREAPVGDRLETLGRYSQMGGYIIIPPNGFVLTHTKEYLRIPRDILVVCLGKSTYARVGIVANITPLEPEWEGQITIELSNTSPYPVKIYANEGIAQLVFHKADRVCKTSYKDKKGKYQGQTGVTGAKV